MPDFNTETTNPFMMNDAFREAFGNIDTVTTSIQKTIDPIVKFVLLDETIFEAVFTGLQVEHSDLAYQTYSLKVKCTNTKEALLFAKNVGLKNVSINIGDDLEYERLQISSISIDTTPNAYIVTTELWENSDG